MPRATGQGETVTFRIDPDLKSELIKLADRDHKSLGGLLRELARDRLAQEKDSTFRAEARRQCLEIAAARETDSDEAEVERWIDQVADTEGWKS